MKYKVAFGEKFMRLLTLLLLCGPLVAQQHGASTPEAAGNLPAQKIGPRDLIALQVYDSPELSRTSGHCRTAHVLPPGQHPVRPARRGAVLDDSGRAACRTGASNPAL